MRRDLVTGKLYFHHLPLAATANFRGSKVTQKFDQLVNDAVKDFRSVGLFCKTRLMIGSRRPAYSGADVSQHGTQI